MHSTGCQFHILHAITYHLASGFDEINTTGLYLGMTDRIRQLSEARLRQGAKTESFRKGYSYLMGGKLISHDLKIGVSSFHVNLKCAH